MPLPSDKVTMYNSHGGGTDESGDVRRVHSGSLSGNETFMYGHSHRDRASLDLLIRCHTLVPTPDCAAGIATPMSPPPIRSATLPTTQATTLLTTTPTRPLQYSLMAWPRPCSPRTPPRTPLTMPLTIPPGTPPWGGPPPPRRFKTPPSVAV